MVAGAFDTETTGLHPVVDTPFLFQCGYYNTHDTGVVYIVDIERTPLLAKAFIAGWHRLAEQFPIYLGHHVIFDLHMLTNIGLPYNYYDNLSDTQFYIRASSDAIQTDCGGEPLALKDWACRHINRDANKYEKELKLIRTKMAHDYNEALLKATGWKKGKFNDFFNDKTHDYNDLPQDIRDAWLKWRDSLPEYLRSHVTSTVDSDDIRYSELPRERVIEYGYYDIEYTLEVYRRCLPVLNVRQNALQVQLENANIPVYFEMERVGFKVDTDYLEACRVRTKEYIKQRRADLELQAGMSLKCSQNAAISKLLQQWGIALESTDKEHLELLVNRLKVSQPEHPAIELCETVLELRTLEKWYSTYICRFQSQLAYSKLDRIYTSIHQVQAVSGRISCDFQQFPKAGLKSVQGEDLFDPRRMVITDDEYPVLCYLDYSAQELRIQCLYTYLLGYPDYNMMKAYAPWKCHRTDGTEYNPENAEHRRIAYDGQWLDEHNQPWRPTDLHGAMTHTIFPELSEDSPEWHDIRYVGKRTNFAKNYGASYTRIREMFPEFDDDTCHRIDEAYYKTFPGVKKYHEWCFERAGYSYTSNLYGVKYYGVSGHKLRNVLVQGSAAYMTKDRQVAARNYLKSHGYKTKMVMPIHDEVIFAWHKDDPIEVLWELKAIMGDVDSQVPLVSDMEITTTNWKEKYEVTDIETLYAKLKAYKPD